MPMGDHLSSYILSKTCLYVSTLPDFACFTLDMQTGEGFKSNISRSSWLNMKLILTLNKQATLEQGTGMTSKV